MVPWSSNDEDLTRRFHSVWTLSTCRDLLMVLMLVVAGLGVARGSEASHDVFASSEHLRQLADSERLLVPALRQYVAAERRRLQHILRSARRQAFTDSLSGVASVIGARVHCSFAAPKSREMPYINLILAAPY